MTFGFFKTKVHSTRHYSFVMAFAVVLVVGLVYVMPYVLLQFHASGPTDASRGDSLSTTTATYTRSAPIRIQIPTINLDTTFVPPLGLNADKTVSVPDSYTKVGWYSGGATPGEVGPAVILGHVDSVDGPAIFYSLGQVKVGDEITVTRDDGTVATFLVTELKRYPQSEFPTLAVYGPTTDAELRLVTCTGTFNRGEQRYSHNLVVYATLK